MVPLWAANEVGAIASVFDLDAEDLEAGIELTNIFSDDAGTANLGGGQNDPDDPNG